MSKRLMTKIKPNELIVTRNKEFVDMQYGITADIPHLHLSALYKIEHERAIRGFGKGELLSDFMQHIRFDDVQYFTFSIYEPLLYTAAEFAMFNIYENRDVVGDKRLVGDGSGNYERIYWFRQRLVFGSITNPIKIDL